MGVEIRNEFAAVEVGLDRAANGPRLRVRDLESGACVFLDPFVLRSLAVLPAEALEALCRATVPVEADGGGSPHPWPPGAVAAPVHAPGATPPSTR